MVKKSIFIFCSLIGMIAPLFAGSMTEIVDSVEHWWCSACGLAYPTTQKVCLNKDCPMFKKPR